MARDPEAINSALSELVQPEARGRLLALGLARGMVWTNGVVPEGVPERLSSTTLTRIFWILATEYWLWRWNCATQTGTEPLTRSFRRTKRFALRPKRSSRRFAGVIRTTAIKAGTSLSALRLSIWPDMPQGLFRFCRWRLWTGISPLTNDAWLTSC